MKHLLPLVSAALLLGAAPPAVPPATGPAAEPTPDGVALDLGKDGYQRMTVPVNIDGLGPSRVIVDTGAQTSVGNTALRHALERHHKLPEPTPLTMISVTGGHVVADATVIRRIRLGDAYIQDMPIAFADVAPFKKLDLLGRPA